MRSMSHRRAEEFSLLFGMSTGETIGFSGLELNPRNCFVTLSDLTSKRVDVSSKGGGKTAVLCNGLLLRIVASDWTWNKNNKTGKAKRMARISEASLRRTST